MTDYPCPAEVVDLLLAGQRLPREFKGVRLIPDDIGRPNLPHPVTDGLTEEDE